MKANWAKAEIWLSNMLDQLTEDELLVLWEKLYWSKGRRESRTSCPGMVSKLCEELADTASFIYRLRQARDCSYLRD
jgi:hypothetical protein